MYTRFYVLTPNDSILVKEIYESKEIVFSRRELRNLLHQRALPKKAALIRQHVDKDDPESSYFEAEVPNRRPRVFLNEGEDRRQSTIRAAQGLFSFRKSFAVFNKLEDAKAEAEKNLVTKTTTNEMGDFDFHLKEYYHKVYQPAVVEIYVNIDENQLNQVDLDEKSESEKSVSRKIILNPEHTFMTRAWIQGQAVAIRTNPQSYYDIFNRHSNDCVSQVSALFKDYYNPAFFSCHWRHHKECAREIVINLNGKNIQEAFDYLFTQRQISISSTNVNRTGSFMRRLEAALSLLIEKGAVPIDDSCKQTACVRL